MKKLRILFAIIIVALQGFIACRSDEISPQTLRQKAQNLVKEYKLRRVTTLLQSEPILYLKDVEKVAHFFSLLKNTPKLSQSRIQVPPITWVSPHSGNDFNVHGIFTFPENTKAEMKFDRRGNISDLSVNNESIDISYDYDPSSGYLQITKWVIIAIPQIENPTPLISSYDYYYAPITRWETSLSSAWSRVQFFNVEANLTIEDFGEFKVLYTSLESPVIEPIKPSQEKFRGNNSSQIVPTQNN